MPSTSCDLFTYRVWSYSVWSFRGRSIYKYIHYLTFDGQGHTKCSQGASTSCDLFTYRDWSYYVWSFRGRSIYKYIQYLTFDLDLGVKVTRNVTQYPLHHVTYQAKSLKLLRLTVKKEIHLPEKNIIWPLTLTLGSRSHEMLPSTLYIMWPI